MMERRQFIGSLAGLLSPELLPALEAIAANPGAELPAIKAVTRLGTGRPEDEKFWSRVRDLFYVPRDVIYLNNGSLGLSHRVVVEAMYRHLLESESVRTTKYGDYPWWGYGPALEIRKKVSAFIGADPDLVPEGEAIPNCRERVRAAEPTPDSWRDPEPPGSIYHSKNARDQREPYYDGHRRHASRQGYRGTGSQQEHHLSR